MSKGEAELIAGAVRRRDFPPRESPEVVLAGRSNVGKSSLINRLAGSDIARTGCTPGTTQCIRFYRIRNRFVFVDLPGYGYARAAKATKEEWRRLVEDYFASRRSIALVIHLIDARLAPMPIDLQLQEWLDGLGLPRLLAATKADKLSGNGRTTQERVLSSAFGRPVVMCSAVTGMGCKEIWTRVLEVARPVENRAVPVRVPRVSAANRNHRSSRYARDNRAP